MRIQFCQAIETVLRKDEKAVLISGDLGFKAFEPVQRSYPERFLNAGVAEQSMMSIASGMAMTGMRPWVYSIIPFATLRCLEQIRNDVCFHRLPIKIVGNGGGFTYGIMGSTHHALEDLGVLKTLPNLTLLFPSANDQVARAVELAGSLQGPCYLRLGISPYSPPDPLSEDPITLTRRYRSGSDATLIGVGQASPLVLEALRQPSLSAASVDVFSVSRFPLDLKRDRALHESALRTRKVVVVEEHYLAGGMGESLQTALPRVPVFEIIAPDYQEGRGGGSIQFLLEQCRMSPALVAERIAAVIR